MQVTKKHLISMLGIYNSKIKAEAKSDEIKEKTSVTKYFYKTKNNYKKKYKGQ